MVVRVCLLFIALTAANTAAVVGFTAPITIRSTRRWVVTQANHRGTLQHEQVSLLPRAKLRLGSQNDPHVLENLLSKSSDNDMVHGSTLQYQVLLISLMAATLVVLPDSADAAAGGYNAVPSALVAYGHYAGLLVSTGAIVTERSIVDTNMSPEQEKTLLYADIVNQLALLTIGWSGYLRVMEYGKGWEFYSHEPLFWIKVAFFGIVEATSLFPTIQIVQRAILKSSNDNNSLPSSSPSWSEARVARMKQLMNTELHSLLTIPIVATFMARGILYMDNFPWQAGAAGAAMTFVGFALRYSKEALTWTEPPAKDPDFTSIITNPK